MDKLETKLETTRQELNARMDKQDARMDKLDEKIDSLRTELNARMDKQDARIDKLDDKIDKLADKIDEMHRELKSSLNHGQIATISTIGIAIAVIYSLIR